MGQTTQMYHFLDVIDFFVLMWVFAIDFSEQIWANELGNQLFLKFWNIFMQFSMTHDTQMPLAHHRARQF